MEDFSLKHWMLCSGLEVSSLFNQPLRDAIYGVLLETSQSGLRSHGKVYVGRKFLLRYDRQRMKTNNKEESSMKFRCFSSIQSISWEWIAVMALVLVQPICQASAYPPSIQIQNLTTTDTTPQEIWFVHVCSPIDSVNPNEQCYFDENLDFTFASNDSEQKVISMEAKWRDDHEFTEISQDDIPGLTGEGVVGVSNGGDDFCESSSVVNLTVQVTREDLETGQHRIEVHFECICRDNLLGCAILPSPPECAVFSDQEQNIPTAFVLANLDSLPHMFDISVWNSAGWSVTPSNFTPILLDSMEITGVEFDAIIPAGTPYETTSVFYFAATAQDDQEITATESMLLVVCSEFVGVNTMDLNALREKLEQNHPNPFNPQTTIAFNLPKEMPVSLRVYDVSGRLVDVLLDDRLAQQGRNEVVWRGRDLAGRLLPSGTYFYRLEAGSFGETKRMTLLK